VSDSVTVDNLLLHIQPFTNIYFPLLSSVTSVTQSQFRHLCFVHNCPWHARPNGGIAITAIFKLCPPFCDMVHSHYVITTQLYKLWVNVNGGGGGGVFPVSLTWHVNLSHLTDWLTDSYAVCCMLPVLHVLLRTLKQNNWLTQTYQLWKLNLDMIRASYWKIVLDNISCWQSDANRRTDRRNTSRHVV
jgi:hypothetical protein